MALKHDFSLPIASVIEGANRLDRTARVSASRKACVIVTVPFVALPIEMSIDSAAVRHIARLARIAVADDELSALAGELGRVLELADQLAGAQIDGVAPLAHPHEQTLAWRDDVVTESDRAETFLALAPDARAGLYLVPKVIE